MNPWTTFDRDFNEQLAGITPPAEIPCPLDEPVRARMREVTPAPLWQSHQGHEL